MDSKLPKKCKTCKFHGWDGENNFCGNGRDINGDKLSDDTFFKLMTRIKTCEYVKKKDMCDVWIDAIGKMGEQMRNKKQAQKSMTEAELMIKIGKLIDEYEYPNGSYERTIGCEISFVDQTTGIMRNYSYNGESFVKIGRGLLWETRNQRKTK